MNYDQNVSADALIDINYCNGNIEKNSPDSLQRVGENQRERVRKREKLATKPSRTLMPYFPEELEEEIIIDRFANVINKINIKIE